MDFVEEADRPRSLITLLSVVAGPSPDEEFLIKVFECVGYDREPIVTS